MTTHKTTERSQFPTPAGGAADRPVANSQTRLTRAQVADRLGASISTVRRYEGELLHPELDETGVRWFDPGEVTKVAAMRANKAGTKTRKRRNGAESAPTARTADEIAAQVFERLEQRQSLAEIVMGVRVGPEKVRELFEQWCVGLTEGQLKKPEPKVPLEHDTPRVSTDHLAALLAALPEAKLTRISVARHRGDFAVDGAEYMDVVELGGFQAAGPVRMDEITSRFGAHEFRITAYGFDPPAIRWEVVSSLPTAR